MQDDDCHWYLIPASEASTFRQWVDAVGVESGVEWDRYACYRIGGSPSDYSFLDPLNDVRF